MNALVAIAMLTVQSQQPAPAQEAPPTPVKVKLSRTYKAGESQAYKAWFTMKSDDMPSEMKVEGEFIRTTKELAAEGEAKVETEYRVVKMSFGDEAQDAEELPKPFTTDHGALGLPKAFDLNDEGDPLGFVLAAFMLPGKEAEIGKAFPMTWSSSAESRFEGEGTLIATGMLYEEHVAKVRVTMKGTPKDDVSSSFEYTAYFNTETGKLVKAEGTVATEGEELGKATVKFDVSKVRDKK
ncbi:MAG: hypothetical protein H0W86_10700 [Armatimonadetes bacterium]|nr:hypothetical protein [Armatimonadota bacterium]